MKTTGSPALPEVEVIHGKLICRDNNTASIEFVLNPSESDFSKRQFQVRIFERYLLENVIDLDRHSIVELTITKEPGRIEFRLRDATGEIDERMFEPYKDWYEELKDSNIFKPLNPRQ